MPYIDFTDEDIEALRTVIAQSKSNIVNSTVRLSSRDVESTGEDHQASDVYIAYPQGHTGIPPLARNTGTGSGSALGDDKPGSKTCYIHSIDSEGYLQDRGFTKTVYNLSPSYTAQDWFPVVKTKGGKWIAVESPAMLEGVLSSAMTAASDILTGATQASMSVYIPDTNYNTNNDLQDSGLSVTVTNRDTTLTGSSGDYIIVRRINTEWRPIWLSCSDLTCG